MMERKIKNITEVAVRITQKMEEQRYGDISEKC